MSSPRLAALGWLLGSLVLGAALALWLAAGRQDPPREAAFEVPRAARVLEVPVLALRPRARGFGIARPGQTWQAVAQVRGTVIHRHPNLEDGALAAAGTRLLAIDPSEYRLAIAEAEAELAALAAERDQLGVEAANLQQSLAIEGDRLTLAEGELERARTLARAGTIPAAQRDEQEKLTLQHRQAVQDLSNRLQLVPSRRQRLEAESDRVRSRLERARKDLADTELTAPFDLRVAEVKVDRHQFVSPGQLLFSADGIATAEVAAQIPLEPFRRLVGSVLKSTATEGLQRADDIDFGAVDAEVRLVAGGGAHWPARVARVESGLDPRTRTAQVAVVVDEPYRKARPPELPPLIRNMYVEVVLAGRPLVPRPVVPESAVHESRVYLLDAENRLLIRPVAVAFRQDGLAVIDAGLEGGERLVLDDLVPAIEGMAIAPQFDEEAADRLRRRAAGEDG